MRLTNLYEVQRYIKACAKRANINVVFTAEKEPRTDGNIVYVPEISRYTSDDELAEYLYTIEHEAAHHVHSNFGALKYDAKTFSGQMHNILEDFRTNRLEADDYAGFEQNVHQVHPKLLDVLRKNYSLAAPMMEPAEKDRFEKLIATAAVCEQVFSSSPDLQESADKLANVSSNVKQYTDKLKPYAKQIQELVDTDTAGSLALAEKIIREVFELDPEAKEQSEQQMKQTVANPDVGAGKKDGEGKGELPGEGAPGAEGGKDGEPGDDPNYGKKSNQKHKLAAVNNHAYLTRAVTDDDVYNYGVKWTPVLLDDNVIINDFDHQAMADKLFPPDSSPRYFRRDASNFMYAEREYRKNYNDVVNGSGSSVEGFADKVRRMLQIRTRDRFEYGVKRGKLDQSRLARITLKDAHGFNERVFKRKIVNDALDTAVTVLLDCSGSMGGTKWTHAVQAGVLLNHTIANALNIPLELLAFTDNEQGTVLYEIKPFHRLRTSDDEVLSRLAKAGGFMSANADGEAILLAYDRLVRRREKRKLLIVVSDGEPAATRGGDIGTFTKEVVKEIEQGKRVEIYGLGILSNSVRRYYTQNSVVSNAQDLEPALLQLIDKKLV